MLTNKELIKIKTKAAQWGEKNPAKALIHYIQNNSNPRINELISNPSIVMSKEDLILDDFGFNLIDYASVLELKQHINLFDYYLPIMGEFNYNKESPLIKNLSFDKKTIIGSQSFLLNSKYDFLSEKNFNDSVKLIFPNAGKKTFKLMQNFLEKDNCIDFTVFHFAHYCSVYFQDANYFNEILENVESIDFFESLVPLHYIIERMSEKRLQGLIIDSSKFTASTLNMLVLDTINMYKTILRTCPDDYEIDFKSINTIKDLHDSIINDFNLISRHGENMLLFLERKFPFLNHLSKETFRNLSIRIPKDKATLVEWGTLMGNCIGGYSHNARDGQTIVLALYENDKIKFNIEISPESGEIRQFVSHSNNRAEQNIQNEFQALVNKFFQKVIIDGEGKILNLPVDRRFIVQVIKTDSPVSEDEVFFNDLFQLNLGPKTYSGKSLKITQLGMSEDIPKGIISLILEDKNSKGSFCNKLAENNKTAYTGLLRHFKDENHLNMRAKDYNEIINEIREKKKEGYSLFFIGIDKLVKIKNKIPSAMQIQDYNDLKQKLDEVLDENINVFFVINDVKKAKTLIYKDERIIEGLVHQIFFTHKEKIIDDFFKVDVVKNYYGKNNCVFKLKE